MEVIVRTKNPETNPNRCEGWIDLERVDESLGHIKTRILTSYQYNEIVQAREAVISTLRFMGHTPEQKGVYRS